MKKLFGGIDLSWKRLIIFAIISGVYIALMSLIPITKDTSFRDIAIMFEWWILFGIIIICNSKNSLDSALKCFVFFLISQPLVYLIQVPFSEMGWKLFGYYRYWFYWTLACFPMGFIGYYIKEKNWLSVLIISPMIAFLVFLGLGYIKSAIETFPHHLLSGIACFSMIIIIVLNLFDKKKIRLVLFGITLVMITTVIILNHGLFDSKFEAYFILDTYDITLVGKVEIISTSGNKEGSVNVIQSKDGFYSVKLSGWFSGKYSFTIGDEANNTYDFEYYYDKESKSVILNKK